MLITQLTVLNNNFIKKKYIYTYICVVIIYLNLINRRLAISANHFPLRYFNIIVNPTCETSRHLPRKKYK